MKLIILFTSILLMLVAIIVILPQFMTTNIQTAIIQDVQGDVQIEQSTKTYTAKENEKLHQGDVIITQESQATVILYESIIILLEPNTKLVLYNLSKSTIDMGLTQGEAWIKATRINGIREVTITTPSIKTMLEKAEIRIRPNYIQVSQGVVQSYIHNQWYESNPEEIINVQGTEILFENTQNEQKTKEKSNAQKVLQKLKDMRTQKLEKITRHPLLLRMYYGTDKKELEFFLQNLDEKSIPIENAFFESPMKTESMRKLIELSDAIIEQQDFVSTFP